MISSESQVLQRHLALIQNKSLVFAGSVNDDFPFQLTNQCQELKVFSCYFDYAKKYPNAVSFGVTFDLPEQLDLLIYYWGKNKQEVWFQLSQLLSQAQLGQQVLIIGENRCGVKSVEKLLSPFGELYKMDSARRCSLYHFTLNKPLDFNFSQFWKSYSLDQFDLSIHSLPGVFSANELDLGTALLIETLPTLSGRILDVGCGAGVLGSYIKQHNPKADVTMTDIHAMALVSAQCTLQENQLQAQVIASDVFSDVIGKFDFIISNPPFHDGIDTAYNAVNTLIQQAKWYLNEGGELRIVANAFLPYPALLEKHFGQYEVLAKTSKFKVYSAKN